MQVDRVHYPGLPSSPDHARAKAFFDGSGGGVLAFEVRGGAAAADALLAVRASNRQCCMHIFSDSRPIRTQLLIHSPSILKLYQ